MRRSYTDVYKSLMHQQNDQNLAEDQLVNTEALPTNPGFGSATPAASGPASAPGLREASQDGSTAPTTKADCCPPLPGQQPAAPSPPQQESGGLRYGPDGNIIPVYTSGQGPEDDERGNKWKRALTTKGDNPGGLPSGSRCQWAKRHSVFPGRPFDYLRGRGGLSRSQSGRRQD
ncbi:MAG: hypothetical protein PHO89_09545 [Methylacidiphilaceae bacterium]|nr:hypothetical protein [Candidatus Methylacidiphilaceae bacterium]